MDWVTVLIYVSIMFLGWLNIYAAVYDPEFNDSLFNFSNGFGSMPLQMKQFFFIIASVVIIRIILIVDMPF